MTQEPFARTATPERCHAGQPAFVPAFVPVPPRCTSKWPYIVGATSDAAARDHGRNNGKDRFQAAPGGLCSPFARLGTLLELFLRT
jgi:hypothetical protein